MNLQQACICEAWYGCVTLHQMQNTAKCIILAILFTWGISQSWHKSLFNTFGVVWMPHDYSSWCRTVFSLFSSKSYTQNW